eukprot:851305_1
MIPTTQPAVNSTSSASMTLVSQTSAQTSPQTSEQSVSQTATPTATQTSADIVPQISTETVPQTSVPIAPHSSAKIVPQTSTQTAPQTSAQTAPQISAQNASQIISAPNDPHTSAQNLPLISAQTVHQASSQTLPQISAQSAPQISAQTDHQISAQTAPQESAQVVPRTSVQTAPQTSLQILHQTSAQTVPEISVQSASQTSAQTVPQISTQTVHHTSSTVPQISAQILPQIPAQTQSQTSARTVASAMATSPETQLIFSQTSVAQTIAPAEHSVVAPTVLDIPITPSNSPRADAKSPGKVLYDAIMSHSEASSMDSLQLASTQAASEQSGSQLAPVVGAGSKRSGLSGFTVSESFLPTVRPVESNESVTSPRCVSLSMSSNNIIAMSNSSLTGAESQLVISNSEAKIASLHATGSFQSMSDCKSDPVNVEKSAAILEDTAMIHLSGSETESEPENQSTDFGATNEPEDVEMSGDPKEDVNAGNMSGEITNQSEGLNVSVSQVSPSAFNTVVSDESTIDPAVTETGFIQAVSQSAVGGPAPSVEPTSQNVVSRATAIDSVPAATQNIPGATNYSVPAAMNSQPTGVVYSYPTLQTNTVQPQSWQQPVVQPARHPLYMHTPVQPTVPVQPTAYVQPATYMQPTASVQPTAYMQPTTYMQPTAYMQPAAYVQPAVSVQSAGGAIPVSSWTVPSLGSASHPMCFSSTDFNSCGSLSVPAASYTSEQVSQLTVSQSAVQSSSEMSFTAQLGGRNVVFNMNDSGGSPMTNNQGDETSNVDATNTSDTSALISSSQSISKKSVNSVSKSATSQPAVSHSDISEIPPPPPPPPRNPKSGQKNFKWSNTQPATEATQSKQSCQSSQSVTQSSQSSTNSSSDKSTTSTHNSNISDSTLSAAKTSAQSPSQSLPKSAQSTTATSNSSQNNSPTRPTALDSSAASSKSTATASETGMQPDSATTKQPTSSSTGRADMSALKPAVPTTSSTVRADISAMQPAVPTKLSSGSQIRRPLSEQPVLLINLLKAQNQPNPQPPHLRGMIPFPLVAGVYHTLREGQVKQFEHDSAAISQLRRDNAGLRHSCESHHQRWLKTEEAKKKSVKMLFEVKAAKDELQKRNAVLKRNNTNLEKKFSKRSDDVARLSGLLHGQSQQKTTRETSANVKQLKRDLATERMRVTKLKSQLSSSATTVSKLCVHLTAERLRVSQLTEQLNRVREAMEMPPLSENTGLPTQAKRRKSAVTTRSRAPSPATAMKSSPASSSAAGSSAAGSSAGGSSAGRRSVCKRTRPPSLPGRRSSTRLMQKSQKLVAAGSQQTRAPTPEASLALALTNLSRPVSGDLASKNSDSQSRHAAKRTRSISPPSQLSTSSRGSGAVSDSESIQGTRTSLRPEVTTGSDSTSKRRRVEPPPDGSNEVGAWSEGEVGRWLSEFKWGTQYVSRFKESAVDGQLLLQLNEDILQCELDITNAAHRKRMVIEINNLKRGKQSVENMTFSWGEPIAVGARMDACDNWGQWYCARVASQYARGNEILIHFDRWSTRFDEWISVDSDRLAKRGAKVDEKPDIQNTSAKPQQTPTTPTNDDTSRMTPANDDTTRVTPTDDMAPVSSTDQAVLNLASWDYLRMPTTSDRQVLEYLKVKRAAGEILVTSDIRRELQLGSKRCSRFLKAFREVYGDERLAEPKLGQRSKYHTTPTDEHTTPAENQHTPADEQNTPADEHNLSADEHTLSADEHTLSADELPAGSFEIESILGTKLDRRGKRLYLVKWRGFPNSENTWEPPENFGDNCEVLQAFEAELKYRK